MDSRNLTLFFLDDRVPPYDLDFVDLVINTRLGWEMHCLDIFERPMIEFDLLSADVNFSDDKTDPSTGTGDHNTTWGLIHALAALARREHQDTYRNRMPLAWEVRSISPNAYRKDFAGTRAYGLLRALATVRRDDDETIFECVQREYAEAYNQRLDIPQRIIDNEDINFLFVEDLAQQPSYGTSIADALLRLLPYWRKRFVEAVRTDVCRLGVEAARTQFKELQKLDRVAVTVEDGPVLPIGDEHFLAKYGLRLSSIFADKLTHIQGRDAVLMLKQKHPDLALADLPHLPLSIIDWYRNVVDIGASVKASGDPVKVLENVIESAYPLILEDRKNGLAVGKLSNQTNGRSGFKPRQRPLLLCFLSALNVLEKDPPVSSLKDLENCYRLSTNTQTWARSARRHPDLLASLRPHEIFENVVLAMRDDPRHRLGECWDWLSDGLARWVEKQANPSNKDNLSDWRNMVARRAPGLVKKQPRLRETLESWKR